MPSPPLTWRTTYLSSLIAGLTTLSLAPPCCCHLLLSPTCLPAGGAHPSSRTWLRCHFLSKPSLTPTPTHPPALSSVPPLGPCSTLSSHPHPVSQRTRLQLTLQDLPGFLLESRLRSTSAPARRDPFSVSPEDGRLPGGSCAASTFLSCALPGTGAGTGVLDCGWWVAGWWLAKCYVEEEDLTHLGDQEASALAPLLLQTLNSGWVVGTCGVETHSGTGSESALNHQTQTLVRSLITVAETRRALLGASLVEALGSLARQTRPEPCTRRSAVPRPGCA